MTVGAVVIGFAAMMVTAPVNSYLDQSERAELNDDVDTVTRLLDEDLRKALPNSVSIRNAGTRSIVEMLIVDQVAFYRGAGELGTGQELRELTFSPLADPSFSAFGGLNGPVSSDRRLVISNMGRGTGAYNAYGTNATHGAMLPASATVTITSGTGEDILGITTSFRFPDPDPTQTILIRPALAAVPRNRMFIVSGAVTYICNTATNTQALRRYADYGIRQNIATTEAALSAGTSTLVANNVASCQFSCDGNDDVCLRTLVAQIELSRTSSTGGTERIRLHRQYSMDNDL